MQAAEGSIEAAIERRSPLVALDPQQVQDALRVFLPSASLSAVRVAVSGRSNTNYIVDTDQGRYVLRVHARDSALGTKERALFEHCRRLVPLAMVLGTSPGVGGLAQPFSLLEFVAGDTLETVIQTGDTERLDSAACNLGHALAQLASCRFERAGDLVADANGSSLVVSAWPFDDFDRWALFESPAGARLGPLRDEVWQFLTRTRLRYARQTPPHLVHGDFNPTNLLIGEDGEVTAILDWEFSHAGSLWSDVGNLLRQRAGASLPRSFAPHLLEGLTDGGVTPPKDWYALALLADLSSAFEFLSSADDRPQTHARALSQIRGTLTALRE